MLISLKLYSFPIIYQMDLVFGEVKHSHRHECLIENQAHCFSKLNLNQIVSSACLLAQLRVNVLLILASATRSQVKQYTASPIYDVCIICPYLHVCVLYLAHAISQYCKRVFSSLRCLPKRDCVRGLMLIQVQLLLVLDCRALGFHLHCCCVQQAMIKIKLLKMQPNNLSRSQIEIEQHLGNL